MTIQEEIQQLTEQWLSIFAGLVRSGQLYSVDVQAKLLLCKLHLKDVVIKINKPDADFYYEPLLKEVMDEYKRNA